MTYNVPPSDLIEFIGFAPDADPNTPGAFLDCTLVIPTHRGFRLPRVPRSTTATVGTANSFPAPITSAYWDEESAQFKSCMVHAYDATAGVGRFYSANFNTLFDVTPTAGGNTGFTQAQFVKFGGFIVAANPSSHVLSSLVTKVAGAVGEGEHFVPINGSPQVRYITVAERFVLGVNGPSGAGGEWYGDEWYCCARDNHLSWTATPSTLAAFGRLPDQFGEFLGLIALNSQVYAFKSKTCYIGRFTGPPEVWSWREWPFRLGAICPPAHYKQGFLFLADDDLYFYDGASLRGLMRGKMQQFYIDNMTPTEFARIAVDESHDLVYLRMIGSIGGSFHDDPALKTYVCHIPSGKWGVASIADVKLYFPGPNQNTSAISSGSYPNNRGAQAIWAISFDNKIKPVDENWTRDPDLTDPWIETHDFGDAFEDVELTGVRVKYASAPGNGSLIAKVRNRLSDPLAPITDSINAPISVLSSDGDFNFRTNGRWHRLKLFFSETEGNLVEFTGMRLNIEPRGKR